MTTATKRRFPAHLRAELTGEEPTRRVIWFRRGTGRRTEGPTVTISAKAISFNGAIREELLRITNRAEYVSFDIGFDLDQRLLLFAIRQKDGDYMAKLANSKSSTLKIGGQALGDQIAKCGVKPGRYPARFERGMMIADTREAIK